MEERKVVVITGAGSGIGRGLARIADQRGMQIVIADIDEKGLQETASQVGADAMTVPVDVCDEAGVEALADRVFSQFGRVDLLFNNAGILRGGLSWEIGLDQWRRVLDVNIMGVINGLNKFVPRMIASDRPCRIVNTASLGGFLASPFISPYTATKFAVVALTESLAVELQLRKTKVAVSLLAPGPVKSNIYSDPRTSAFDKDVQHMIDAFGSFTGDLGLDPDSFAHWVFERIDAERFWLISHSDMFHPLIEQRTKLILAGINPEPQHYGSALAEHEAQKRT